MKAKRIAEIAHEMAQLRAEMDALSADLKDEYGKCAAHLIAKAIIENTLKATPFATAASSDQLRAELTANNIEMNRLTERNDAILSTLRGRGLEPVRVRDDVKCKVRFVVDKPLTNEQLRSGDWYCKDITEDCRSALLGRGFKSMSRKWPCEMHDYKYSAMGYDSVILLREHDLEIYAYDRLDEGVVLREIIRKGNEFYYV